MLKKQTFPKSLTLPPLFFVCVFMFICKWVAKTEEIGERRNEVEDFNESGKLATNSGSFEEAFILARSSINPRMIFLFFLIKSHPGCLLIAKK